MRIYGTLSLGGVKFEIAWRKVKGKRFDILWSPNGLKCNDSELRQCNTVLIDVLRRIEQYKAKEHYQWFPGGPSSIGDHLERFWMIEVFLKKFRLSRDFVVEGAPEIEYDPNVLY